MKTDSHATREPGETNLLSRRNFLQLSGLGLGGLLLWGCREDPPNPSPIGWQPHALTPIFYGLRDYGTADGAPGPCRVFFPSLDGSPDSAAVLPPRRPYPLIVFAHGHCNEAGHYKKWFHLPAQLAKCGYVVAVPELPGISIHPSDPTHPALTRLGETVAWMRTKWPHRNLARTNYYAVIGHSHGAMLGARLAANSDVTAYVSVAGVWNDWPTTPLPIQQLNKPMCFLWGTEDRFTEISSTTWNSLALPKHRAVFQGGRHWDYLRPGTTTCETKDGRGPCTRTPAIAADLISMFFARYVIPQETGSLSVRVPDSLMPPLPLQLTAEQAFYAGSHLTGFPIPAGSGCTLNLTWHTVVSSGTRRLP